jgi:hypothetical protein
MLKIYVSFHIIEELSPNSGMSHFLTHKYGLLHLSCSEDRLEVGYLSFHVPE